MTGPQTEIEIRLWCDEVARSVATGYSTEEDAMQRADALLAAYRLRYGLPQPAADDRLGRAAIEAMDAILGVMGEDRHDEFTLSAIDKIAQRYVAARWHIRNEKEGGK